MPSRGLVRRVAIACLTILVALGAFAATRYAFDLARRRERGVAAGVHELRRLADLRRGETHHSGPRPRAEAEPGAAAPGLASPGSAPSETAAAGPADASAPVPPRPGEVVRPEPPVNLAEFALPAAPDRDDVTGEAAAVEPGAPPELDIATFVSTSAETVRPVATLVGERKPEVDEGVPVSLTGRVVDDERHMPIEHAQVFLTSTFYVRRYQYDRHLREVARVETDAEGRYAIPRLNVDPAHFGEGGILYVTVTANGFAPALAVSLADVSPGIANKVRDVVLTRGTQTLKGRVIDMWEGLPIPGARVVATGAIDPITYPKDERPALFLGAPTATTDADGRFVLEGLGKGAQMVSVHGGDDCVGEDLVTLPREKDFVLKTRRIGGRIEGTTLDEYGKPISIVTILGGENSTHSFADGRFVLENIRGDVITIVFTHPDYTPVTLEGVQDGAAGLVVHMLKPRPSIVLVVRDADSSEPVTKIRVEMTFADEKARPAPTSPVRLAKDGRYEVRLPEGATSVTVSAVGLASQTMPLAGRNDGEVVPVLLAAGKAK